MRNKRIFTLIILILFFLGISALPIKNNLFNIATVQADLAGEVLGDDDEYEEEDEEDEDDEEEEDEEDEIDESNETEEKVQNQNGTTSTIQRKTEDNGESKLKIKTYNANGALIEEKEYEGDNEEAELQIKQFDQFGNKLLELKYKNEEGNEIKLQIQGSTTGESKIRYDFENQKMFVDVKDDEEELEDKDEIEIEVDENRFKIMHKNTNMYANFPIKIDEETGRIYVSTSNGEVELKHMPDEVIKKALASEEVEEISETYLEEDDDLKLMVDGEKREKLLGILNVEIPKTLVYDNETGELVDISLSPIYRILDFLSL